jgi:hypothetical protein
VTSQSSCPFKTITIRQQFDAAPSCRHAGFVWILPMFKLLERCGTSLAYASDAASNAGAAVERAASSAADTHGGATPYDASP